MATDDPRVWVRRGWEPYDQVMAAPEYVPLRPGRTEKAYESPPRRPDPWLADRPGEVVDDGVQPEGRDLGYQGPDQGFALKLANAQRDKLHLTEREHADDAVTGAVAVAMRRASIYGRAPMIHDVNLAFELFGFLDESAPAELVEWRKPVFEELANPHHYFEVRRLASQVPESTLRMTPADVKAKRGEWRALLGL
jgi:hypothetical protein